MRVWQDLAFSVCLLHEKKKKKRLWGMNALWRASVGEYIFGEASVIGLHSKGLWLPC